MQSYVMNWSSPFNMTIWNSSISHLNDPPGLYTEDNSNQTWINTTSLINITELEEEAVLVPCGLFFFLVYGPLCGLVCLFGLIGNILSFAVLHKYSRNNVATYLLKALAISDSLFLTTAIGVQMYPAMSMYFDLTEQLTPIYPHLQMYAWPIAHIIQMGTTYMMILIAVNRYIAVCKPLHAPRLGSKRQVQMHILIIFLGIITYNVPRFFEYHYIQKNITNEFNITETFTENVGLITYTVYNILYEIVAYCLFVFLVPLLILIVLNVHLVRELKRAQKNRKAIANRRNAEENNITLVIIVIILVFIVCQSPASINQILYYTRIGQSSDGTTCTSYEKYYHISNLLIITNSAVNFIVYCLFRRQFQQELLALFCCGKVNPRTKKTLRRTLLLRALHEHSNSFSNSMTKSFVNHVNSNDKHGATTTTTTTTCSNETDLTEQTTTFSISELSSLQLDPTTKNQQCNGINGKRKDSIDRINELLLKN